MSTTPKSKSKRGQAAGIPEAEVVNNKIARRGKQERKGTDPSPWKSYPSESGSLSERVRWSDMVRRRVLKHVEASESVGARRNVSLASEYPVSLGFPFRVFIKITYITPFPISRDTESLLFERKRDFFSAIDHIHPSRSGL
ncbi:hypothetical protein TNCV_3028251 [Trichonephila clavipes]|nr:hypothetical protein TNCV_3028251 [Trichonephila clavipes]